MKGKMLSVAALLVAGVLVLSGCNKTENNPAEEPEVWMANPASVYCEENGGTLIPAEDEDWNQFAFCQIDEDTICEEWEYYRGECPVVVEEEIENVEEIIDEEMNNEEVNVEEVAEEVNNEEVAVEPEVVENVVEEVAE